MERKPLVTIGVSAYNRKDFLRLALDSLLSQTYPACEIIVIDDGSSDGTGEMMKTEFPQIRYVCQENAGDASAKNHAARIASGEYIVFNDSDDLFLPDTVERLVAALPENEKNACSYGTYQTINAEGKELPTKRKTAVYPGGKITGALLEHILVNSCGTLMPRQVFLDHSGFDVTKRVAHDYCLFLKMSLDCNFYAVQEPVFLRRRHGNNLSSSAYWKIKLVWEILEDFLAENPRIAEQYADVVRRRRADMHHKLARQAAKENLRDERLEHAREAFRYSPGVKNLFHLIAAKF